jgi:hypothetical protein
MRTRNMFVMEIADRSYVCRDSAVLLKTECPPHSFPFFASHSCFTRRIIIRATSTAQMRRSSRAELATPSFDRAELPQRCMASLHCDSMSARYLRTGERAKQYAVCGPHKSSTTCRLYGRPREWRNVYNCTWSLLSLRCLSPSTFSASPPLYVTGHSSNVRKFRYKNVLHITSRFL